MPRWPGELACSQGLQHVLAIFGKDFGPKSVIFLFLHTLLYESIFFPASLNIGKIQEFASPSVFVKFGCGYGSPNSCTHAEFEYFE